jgi:hypothetical protein
MAGLSVLRRDPDRLEIRETAAASFEVGESGFMNEQPAKHLLHPSLLDLDSETAPEHPSRLELVEEPKAPDEVSAADVASQQSNSTSGREPGEG